MPDIVDTVFKLTDDYKKKEKVYSIDSIIIKIVLLAIFPLFIIYNTLIPTKPGIIIINYFKLKHLELNLAFFIGILMLLFVTFSWILAFKSIYANKKYTQKIKDKCNPFLLYTDRYDIGCNQTELDVLSNAPIYEKFSNINDNSDKTFQEIFWEWITWIKSQYLATIRWIQNAGKQHAKYSDYYLKKNDEFQEVLMNDIIDPVLIKVADPAIKIYKYAKDRI